MKKFRGSLFIAALSFTVAIGLAGGSPISDLHGTADATATATGATAGATTATGGAATDLTVSKKKCKDANDAVVAMMAAVDAWGKYDPAKTKYDDLKTMAQILLDHKEKGLVQDLQGGIKTLTDGRAALNTAANPAGGTPSADPEAKKILDDSKATLDKSAAHTAEADKKTVDGGVGKAKPVVAGMYDDLATTFKGLGLDGVKANYPAKGKTVSDKVDIAEAANDAIVHNADGMTALATSYEKLNKVLEGLNAADGAPSPAAPATTPPTTTGGDGGAKKPDTGTKPPPAAKGSSTTSANTGKGTTAGGKGTKNLISGAKKAAKNLAAKAKGGTPPTAGPGSHAPSAGSATGGDKPAATTGGGGGDKPAAGADKPATTGGGGDKPSDDPVERRAALVAVVDGLDATVAGWIKLQPYALDQISEDFHGTIKKGLEDENLTPDLESDMIRTRAFMPKAAALDGYLDPWIAALKKMGAKTDQIEGARPCLKKVPDLSKILNGYLAILDDAVSGLGDDTEQEAIQLFYFGSVPEAMKALNLNASQYTDTFFGASSNLDKLRTELLGKEADARKALDETNELIYHVSEIQAQITRDLAEFDQTTSKLQGINTTLSNYDRQGMKTTNPAYVAVTANKTLYTGEQSRLQDELAKDDGDKKSLQSQLAAAQAASAAAVKSRNELNIDISILASKEVDAFAFERDHHPFWYSLPRKTSADPVKRCLIFGYDNSNVIFVRGAKNDLSAVREILASFDRPAPQAKITLYSLQINGSNASKIAQNISDVTNELNMLEGNMTILQDVLRNSIAREVSRYSRVAKMTLCPDPTQPYPFSDRVWRSFYYPREIRRALGLDIELPARKDSPPDERYNIAAAIDDLGQAEASFKDAVDEHIKAVSYAAIRSENGSKNHESYTRALVQARIKRKIDLTRVGYYFKKAASVIAYYSARCDFPKGQFGNLANLGAYLNYLVRNDEEPDEAYSYALRAAAPSDLLVPATCAKKDFRVSLVEAGKAPGRSYDWQDIQFESNQKKGGTPRYIDPNGFAPPDYSNPYCHSSNQKILLENRQVVDWLKCLLSAPSVQPPLCLSSKFVLSTDKVTRYTLPDPTRGTTLGEMLFVLSLGSKESRERVLHDFAQELFDNQQLAIAGNLPDNSAHGLLQKINELLQGKSTTPSDAGGGLLRLTNSLQALYGNSSDISASKDAQQGLFPMFPRTVFGGLSPSLDQGPGAESLTPNQKEILSAIDTRVREIVASRLSELCDYASDETTAVPQRAEYRYEAEALLGWLLTKDLGRDYRSGPLTDHQDSDSFAANGHAYLHRVIKDMRSQDDDAKLQAWVQACRGVANATSGQNALSKANPRVAAADDMIKRFIVVLEGDLYHFLIGPSLDHMRALATAHGVEFGGMEMEQILATNRFVARVDVNSSASLGSVEAQQVMDISNQLAAIQGRLNEKTKADVDSIYGSTATLGAAAAKSETKGANLGSIAKFGLFGGLLGGLFSQPEPIGEIYSLSGGSQFKVTPIFNQSGQAMHFILDHVQTTELQDPRGTRDPILPRIDRHTINTDVQLSNGQFQVISSFDLNYKVGSPPRRGGGIPPFNQIPILRDIPILGYYTRSGEAAVRQHSLIFASTVMYPTVGDIVNLLVESPPSRGRSYVMPQAKKKKKEEAPASGK